MFFDCFQQLLKEEFLFHFHIRINIFCLFVNIHSFINSMRQNIATYAWGFFFTLNGTMVFYFEKNTTKERIFHRGWKQQKVKNTPLNNFLLLNFIWFVSFGVFWFHFYYFIYEFYVSFVWFINKQKNINMFHTTTNQICISLYSNKAYIHVLFLLKKFVLEYDDVGTMIKRQFGS